MALSADTLLDRLYLKGQVTKWRILALTFAVIATVISFESVLPNSPMEKEYVARVSIDGFVSDNQKFYDLLKTIEKNRKIKAVIVSLDTPGGSAVGGEEIFLRLRQLSQKKPVVAVMRSISASAGYMVALGADYIVAREGTITGSIGVLIQSAEVTQLAEKLGIKPVIIKSSALKGSPSPFEKSTPESEKVISDVINDFYNRFVQMVAERRNLPKEKVVALADGRVYSGKRAAEAKLIDAIGGEQEAMKWLVEQKHISDGLEIKDAKIPQPDNLIDNISQSVTGKFFQSSGLSLDGLLAIWHPELH
jgi:protease IV